MANTNNMNNMNSNMNTNMNNSSNSSSNNNSGSNSSSNSYASKSPKARRAMNTFKMEVADSLGVDLKQGYNGDLTSREAGSIGGEMVKRMIAYAEDNMQEQ